MVAFLSFNQPLAPNNSCFSSNIHSFASRYANKKYERSPSFRGKNKQEKTRRTGRITHCQRPQLRSPKRQPIALNKAQLVGSYPGEGATGQLFPRTFQRHVSLLGTQKATIILRAPSKIPAGCGLDPIFAALFLARKSLTGEHHHVLDVGRDLALPSQVEEERQGVDVAGAWHDERDLVKRRDVRANNRRSGGTSSSAACAFFASHLRQRRRFSEMATGVSLTKNSSV